MRSKDRYTTKKLVSKKTDNTYGQIEVYDQQAIWKENLDVDPRA